MLNMSIFNRAITRDVIFNNIIQDVSYVTPSPTGRDVYTNSVDKIGIRINMNKYSYKLYYEERDASDVLTINTYALPT